MKEVKAYKPKCCKKAYLLKGSASRHEKTCFRNPDNKACLTCDRFKTDYNTVYVQPHGDQNYGDADYEEKYNWCTYDDFIIGTDLYKTDHKQFQSHCNYWMLKVGD